MIYFPFYLLATLLPGRPWIVSVTCAAPQFELDAIVYSLRRCLLEVVDFSGRRLRVIAALVLFLP
jgi:hypothetical protein